ncbi:hypothetical protein [Mammaliicoccus sciuri]|uniref:hypothetical protein n=1 Tax=Mammaliicoccus sciuri TaxID=1296 RepID=UPI001F2A7410|nr:hypothetical protein [Mammaliicoccus sciuri]UIU23197.1 hypothetical protein LLZ87_04700 [Mammaliicoccus sciuri]UIU26102.1 hypothetical protein LLZ92_04700 [Mammaliicoccus sciuri]
MNKIFKIVLKEGFWLMSAFIVAMIIAFMLLFSLKLIMFYMGLWSILFLSIFVPVLILVWIKLDDFREEYM